jgi:hypothetical protein
VGWDLKVREPLAQESGESVRVDRRSIAEDYDGRHLFTQVVAWQTQDRALEDVRMLKELLLDVGAGNVFAASDDDLLRTARDIEIAIGVEMTQVTGVDPSVGVDDAVIRSTPVAIHLCGRPRQYFTQSITVWAADSDLGQRQRPTNGPRTLHEVAPGC